MDKLSLDLTIDGLATQIFISASELETVYLPAVELILNLQGTLGGKKRTVVFLAGAPGCGKSTFCGVLKSLAKSHYGRELNVLAMDGFHFSNSYLGSHYVVLEDGLKVPLIARKGRPESFDLLGLNQHLESLYNGDPLRWPGYDRAIHDVVDGEKIVPDEGLFIVEGNYLLLNEQGWDKLKVFADYSIFLMGSPELFTERLIARHIRGGKAFQAAKKWVMENDLENISLVLENSSPADHVISL